MVEEIETWCKRCMSITKHDFQSTNEYIGSAGKKKIRLECVSCGRVSYYQELK